MGVAMSRNRRTALIAFGLAVFGAFQVGLVQANHSLPPFPIFWDVDNDGVAEAADSAPAFQKLGNLWNATKEARFTEALAEWKNDTDFNPVKVASAVNGVRIDGAVPYCEENWDSVTVAVNCVAYTVRAWGWDIHKSTVYLNEVHFNFSYDDDPPGPGLYDGAGVITHELGHAVLLLDLACTPGPTMCGSTSAAQSFHLRSLDADDISGANSVYLP
jgi:hypothetical protein